MASSRREPSLRLNGVTNVTPLLKAAHEPILLRTALVVDERLPTPAGADVEEHVQERHVGWLSREYVRRRRREHGARTWALELLVEPGVERHCVQRACSRRPPRAVEWDPVRRLLHRRDGGSVFVEVLSVVALLATDPPGLAVLEHDVFAARPLGERGDSRLGGQFVDVVLRRADPLTA